MDSSEILARFGISEKLAYGLFIQSIFVILAAIMNLWRLIEVFPQYGFNYIVLTNIISVLCCISLLVYSFYGFNAEKNQEAYYISAIILYIIILFLGVLSNLINNGSPIGYVIILPLITTIYFLYAYKKNYRSAQYAMLLVLVLQVVVAICLIVIIGTPWYVGLKILIIPVTIALTHFERVQRGKYPNIL